MLTFELVTLQGVKFTEECYEILLPTPQGQIGILPHHIPLVSVGAAGVVSVRRRQEDTDERLEHFAVTAGLVEIDGHRVRLLADEADHADSIDELEVKEAMQRAREMKRTAKDQVAVADAAAIIERSAVRLRVAEIKRRRHPKA